MLAALLIVYLCASRSISWTSVAPHRTSKTLKDWIAYLLYKSHSQLLLLHVVVQQLLCIWKTTLDVLPEDWDHHKHIFHIRIPVEFALACVYMGPAANWGGSRDRIKGNWNPHYWWLAISRIYRGWKSPGNVRRFHFHLQGLSKSKYSECNIQITVDLLHLFALQTNPSHEQKVYLLNISCTARLKFKQVSNRLFFDVWTYIPDKRAQKAKPPKQARSSN